MRKIITCLAVVLCSTSAFSQYYFNTYNPAGTNPGGLNTDPEQPFGAAGVTAADGYTSIIANGTSTLSWSPVQTIPFPFSFNGTPVTQYKVSNSGVLTFTTSATTIPVNANATIPNATIPNNSVMIWGLQQGAGGSSNDGVINKTHGTAPNRQHWVNFASFGAPGAVGSQWTYWGMVLEETTNNIYIADLRTYTTPLSLTLGVQINANLAYSIAGAPNTPSFVTNGGSASDPTDNVYYEFIQGVRPTEDIELTDINVSASITAPFTVSGTIVNKGSVNLTSFDLVWEDVNGIPNSQSFTGNIAPLGSFTFTHNTAWSPAAGQSHDIKVYSSNPNAVADPNNTNDTLTATTFVNNGTSVSRNVLLEEFTTAPCQFCPDGAVRVEQILAANPVVIAVGEHACFGTDAMTIPEASTYCSAFGSGAPTACVDRVLFPGETNVGHGRGTWAANCITQAAELSPVDVTLTGTFNPSTRMTTVNIDADFVDYAVPGDLRLTVFVVEDSVTGVGSGYNQSNAYNTSTGHPYAGAGNPIVGFVHRHVLRDVYPTNNAWGAQSIIAANPGPNSNYSTSYTFSMNSAWKEQDISLVGFVSYFNANTAQREVLNSVEIKLNNLTTSVDEIKKDASSLNIFPNPTADVSTIAFNLSKPQAVIVKVRDITGKDVLIQDLGVVSSGNQKVAVDVSNLSNGIYLTTVQIGKELVTRKITVNK